MAQVISFYAQYPISDLKKWPTFFVVAWHQSAFSPNEEEVERVRRATYKMTGFSWFQTRNRALYPGVVVN